MPRLEDTNVAGASGNLGSSGCESGSSTNGETSDYQRSTPSPRDDEEDIIFLEEDESEEESEDEIPEPPKVQQPKTLKDLGFVDSKVVKTMSVVHPSIMRAMGTLKPLPPPSPAPTTVMAMPKIAFSPQKQFFRTTSSVITTSIAYNVPPPPHPARVNFINPSNGKSMILVSNGSPVIAQPQPPSRCDLIPMNKVIKSVPAPVPAPCLTPAPIAKPTPPTLPSMQQQQQKLLQDMAIRQQISKHFTPKLKKQKSPKKKTPPSKSSAGKSASKHVSTKGFKLKPVEIKLTKLPAETLQKPKEKPTIPKRKLSLDSNNHSDNFPSSKTAKLSSGNLIRPAILNVKTGSSPPPRRSSLEIKSETAKTLPDTKSIKNNPFLPTRGKSSYLFGNSNDFMTATKVFDDDDVVLEIDEDSPDEEPFNSCTTPMINLKKEIKEEKMEKNARELPSPIKSTVNTAISTTTCAIPKPAILTVVKKEAGIEESKTQLRFPTVKGTNNFIECKWEGCNDNFTTYGRLSDHLKLVHVIGQVKECERRENEETFYKCMWSGCKVFDMSSSSRSWLEKHVPIHGGKFAFACIVSGCKKRFSSQKMLSRHVNQHFSENEDKSKSGASTGKDNNSKVSKADLLKGSQKNSPSTSKFPSNLSPLEKASKKDDTLYLARKSACFNPWATRKFSSSTKNLKRAGIRMKYRHDVFSARNFDFFDSGIMAGLKHSLQTLQNNCEKVKMSPDQTIDFRGKILAMNKSHNESKALVRWFPGNILDDEWIELSTMKLKLKKTLKVSLLPEKSKNRLKDLLYGDQSNVPRQRKQTRKSQQGVNVPNMWMPSPPKGLF